MRNTVLSAAHMVRNPVSPGGEDMVKVRLQGTKEDMEWLEEQLLQIPNVKIVNDGCMTISGQQYPRELVKSRFLKLNMSHVEYVINCLGKNTTKVRNIKSYLLASLFNAGSTISSYYRAEVNHDMPQFAG